MKMLPSFNKQVFFIVGNQVYVGFEISANATQVKVQHVTDNGNKEIDLKKDQVFPTYRKARIELEASGALLSGKSLTTVSKEN